MQGIPAVIGLPKGLRKGENTQHYLNPIKFRTMHLCEGFGFQEWIWKTSWKRKLQRNFRAAFTIRYTSNFLFHKQKKFYYKVCRISKRIKNFMNYYAFSLVYKRKNSVNSTGPDEKKASSYFQHWDTH